MQSLAQSPSSALFSQFAANPELRNLLSQNASLAEVAKALKTHAFQQVAFSNMEDRHFMLALLDTLDWAFLARCLLADGGQAVRQKSPSYASAVLQGCEAA
jgi:hypothetical protein